MTSFILFFSLILNRTTTHYGFRFQQSKYIILCLVLLQLYGHGWYQLRMMIDLYRSATNSYVNDRDASLRANFVQKFLQIGLIDLVFFIAFKDLATILDRLLKTKNQ